MVCWFVIDSADLVWDSLVPAVVNTVP